MTPEDTAPDQNCSQCHRAVVLLIHNDHRQLDSLQRGIRIFGHHCIKIQSFEKALELLAGKNGEHIDVVILDLSRSEKEGFDAIEKIKNLNLDTGIIALRGLNWNNTFKSLQESGIQILAVPFSPAQLNTSICTSLNHINRECADRIVHD